MHSGSGWRRCCRRSRGWGASRGTGGSASTGSGGGRARVRRGGTCVLSRTCLREAVAGRRPFMPPQPREVASPLARHANRSEAMSLAMTFRPPTFQKGRPVIADTAARVSGRSAPDTPFGFRPAITSSPAAAHSRQALLPPPWLSCRTYLRRRIYQPATSTMRMATTKAHTVVAP